MASKKTVAPVVEETPEKKELAIIENKNTELSTEVNDLDILSDSAEFASGFSREDFAMPFLQMLQSNSPQVTEGEAKYIEGAKAGMILDTASNTFIDTKKGTLEFIPVTFRRTFIEWVTRENGGGFVKDHGPEGSKLIQKCVKDEKGRYIIPGTSNQLVETMQYVVLYKNADADFIPAMLSLASTQLKRGRQLNTSIENLRVSTATGKVNPPMFYSVFTDGPTVLEKNEKGSWFSHVIARKCDVTALEDGRDLYLQARDLRKSLDSGAIDLSKAAEAESQHKGSVEEDTPVTNGQSYADVSQGAF